MKLKNLLIMIFTVAIAAILYINPLMVTNSDALKQIVGDEDVIESNVDYESESPSELIHSDIKDTYNSPYSNLIESIKDYLEDKDGTYGIYFMSLSTGQSFGLNENSKFIAASTIKLPINLYLFNRISQNKVNPSRKLTYTEAYYEEGTGIIQDEEFGKKYSIRELSRLSIVYSDNIAINMLINHLGRNNILKFMESIVGHTVIKKDNISTPKDMALYMKAVLDFREKNVELGDELLDYLENTEYNDRIPLYIPENIPIAHKIGSQVNAIHDVGTVFAKNPFIISIMSKNVNEDQAPEVIAQITKMVYDFEQN